jgi:predicted Zn finger-like uncharacterized protein
MKFTCDGCSAQYMISDDKVGPAGVKVRCKKCGNVILVRRPGEAAAAPAASASPAAANGGNGTNGAAAPGGGLDAELGQAFDNAFGDGPAPAASREDLGATVAMGAEDAARIASGPAASPAPAETEWYVAIGQAQVGPLPLVEVKKKWEAGDVGPDSLVWRPGMPDWQPLTAVGELARYLAPVPRVAPQPRPQGSRGEPQASRERASETPSPAPAEEVSWKPAGASALAALASEEIAARAAPEPKPAPRPVVSAKSLVDGLPDGGGVDPTGALPLSIKGLEITSEKKIERRTKVASRAEETRHKRSVARVVAIAAVAVILVVGAAAAYVFVQTRQLAAAPPPAVAAAPARPPAAPPPAAPPAPAAAPAPVPAPAPPAAAQAAAPPAPPAAAPAPPHAKEPPAAPPPRRLAKADPSPRREAPRREAAPERAAPAERAAPPPAPTPTAARKKDSLLDFDSNDSALDEALGGKSSGRSVYVPPARAGGAALPEKLSPAQINESVASRIEALRKCVTDQKARDPGSSGVLKLRWVIGGDGSVRDVKTLTSEGASGPFSQCITGVVRSIRFPRSQTTGQEVTFPFSF